MGAETPAEPQAWDIRLIVFTGLTQAAPWLAAALVVTLAGYPGVICVTPMAWLLALRAGQVCISRSKSRLRRRRFQEAALSGAVLGLVEGLAFLAMFFEVGAIQPQEWMGALALAAAIFLAGLPAGAGLALLTAYASERRTRIG